VKSHTPECAKIEQLAAGLVPVKSYLSCVQDFKTKDYRLEFQGRSVTITQQQFNDGTWQEIVKPSASVSADAHRPTGGWGIWILRRCC
jgi:hypothetical protein